MERSEMNKISAVYRGHRARKKLRVFTKLPDEVWRKIVFHIREPLLLEKFMYKPIRKILENYMPVLFKEVSDIRHLYHLVTKYDSVLTSDMKVMLKHYGLWYLTHKEYSHVVKKYCGI